MELSLEEFPTRIHRLNALDKMSVSKFVFIGISEYAVLPW